MRALQSSATYALYSALFTQHTNTSDLKQQAGLPVLQMLQMVFSMYFPHIFYSIAHPRSIVITKVSARVTGIVTHDLDDADCRTCSLSKFVFQLAFMERSDLPNTSH